MEIKIDDLSSTEVVSLLKSHLAGMQAQTPPESVHALNLDAYQSPELTLWTAWQDDVLMGCGALKDLGVVKGERLGEIKSMRTKEEHLRKGVADAVLAQIVQHAANIGLQRLSLETGKTDLFKAAQQFYRQRGFVETEPFADYTNDPHSLFLTKKL